MKRTYRFLLHALVLAGLVIGTAAWVTSGKSVTVRVDGDERHVRTSAATVAGVLAAMKISVTSHDLVAPDPTTPVSKAGVIVVRHGHLVRLTVDGHSRAVWVQASSVGEALDQLGVSDLSAVSVSRSERLDSGTVSVDVRTPKPFTVLVDGAVRQAMVTGPTVAEAVKQSGITLGKYDRLSLAGTAALRSNQIVRVTRVKARLRTTIEATTRVVRVNDPNAWQGTETVASKGVPGRKRVTYAFLYVAGRFIGKKVDTVKVLKAPTPTVIKVGTKVAPWLTDLAPSDPRRIAGGMLLDRGWGEDEYSCLDHLWTKESGWRTDAYNPSGAYGIPQSLPGSKMAAFGDDWQTNAATQIAWGLNYIADVYGDPCSAWAHSQATNWY